MVAQAEMTAYAEQMRRAADGADERPEQWERLRKRLAPRAPGPRHLVTELRQEYEEATGTCLGCD
jgi:hypothetical protein